MGCFGGDDDDRDEKKKYDPHFKGPIADRGCTDVICLILYVAFCVGLAVVSYFAYSGGDPVRLIYPTDTQGNLCGYNNVASGRDFTDKPYLLYFNILDCAKATTSLDFQCPTPQICVHACPNTYWMSITDITLQEASIQISENPVYSPNFTPVENYCRYDFKPKTSLKTLLQMVTAEDCPPYLMKSEPFINRCMPTLLQDIARSGATVTDESIKLAESTGFLEVPDVNGDAIALNFTLLQEAGKAMASYLNVQQISAKVLSDMTAVWPWLLGLLLVSMLVALFWIVLMRWIAGIIIWVLIIATLAALGFGLWYSIDHYLTLDAVSSNVTQTFQLTTEISYYTQNKNFWLATAIITGIVLVVLILLIICLIKRIKLAIQLLNEASKAITAMMTTLFFPLVGYLLQLLVVCGFLVIAVYLASNGDPYYQVSSTDEARNGVTCVNGTYVPPAGSGDKCLFVKYGGDPTIFYLHIYNLFGFFWNLNFVIGFSQMILAGAFASWFWAFNKPKDVPLLPLLSALARTLRYHLGTIAFGAMLIAIVQLIRAVLEYFDNQLKDSESAVSKFFLKCLKCCFWCLEKCLRFLTKNAYIMCAVHGKNFCRSAKDAFFLLLRNVVRVVVINGVTSFLLFFGRLSVTCFCGAIAFVLFTNTYSVPYFGNVGSLNYYWMPVVLVVIGSYVISALFFDVYNVCIDTIFLCFLEDSERHDGTPEKPYFMSKSLLKILGKKNKFHDTR